MDPMVVDMLGCLDGGQCSDKTLMGALGAEVSDYQGTQVYYKSPMGRVRHSNACSLSNSEVSNS